MLLNRRRFLFTLFPAFALSAACAGCGHGPAAHSPISRARPAEAGVYEGTSKCLSCHPGEAHRFHDSRHAHTLREMTPMDLGALAPPIGRVPDTDLVMELYRGRFAVSRPADPRHVLPLSLAFGSGKTGMTYTRIKDGSLFEFRETYFPRWREWRRTPGQDALPAELPGIVHQPAGARQCLGCHAVALPASGLEPRADLMDVGCESCHGPGSLHVKAVKSRYRASGASGGDMEDISRWGARRINEMCGRCHRVESDVTDNPLKAQLTNRFAPYGLMLSRCFRESGDTLSCDTCHDPHRNAGTDDAAYERVCLSCHGAAIRTRRAGVHVCPVNPSTGCIGCHMPKRPVAYLGNIPTTMADHFIRTFPMKDHRLVVSAPSLELLASRGVVMNQ